MAIGSTRSRFGRGALRGLRSIRSRVSTRKALVLVPVLLSSASAGCWILAGVERSEVVAEPNGGAGGGGSTGSGGAASSTGSMMTSAGGSGGGGGASCTDATAYRAAVKSDAPSAYWQFDEPAAATTIADASGNNNSGTVKPGVTLGVPGVLCGGAARFDGVKGYVDFGNKFGFDGMASFAVELWMSPENQGATWAGLVTKEWRDPVSQSDTTRNGWLTWVNLSPPMTQPTTLGFERWLNGLQMQAASPQPPMVSGWNHVVAVYDSTNIGTLSLYLNGMLVGQGSGMGLAMSTNVNSLVVGARFGGSSDWFEGVIDEVAIYDKVLPQARVQAHYAAAKPAP